MNRFKELLTRCTHHGLERWNLYQLAYEGIDMSTRTKVEYMYGKSFFVRMLMKLGIFFEDLSDKTYEYEKIREAPTITSKIFMDNEGKLTNNFISFADTTLYCEHQLEVPLFQPPQAYDYIPSSYSYDFLLNYSVKSYPHPFSQMSFDGISDPSLHSIMINPHLNIRDALRGNMVFDDAPSVLAPLIKNHESEKLVVKASGGLEHDVIVVRKHIFVEGEYLLEETAS